MTENTRPIVLEAAGIETQLGEMKILNGVSVVAREAETVGIIGPNGSGKTTFFNALSGFAPIQKGGLKLGGVDVTTWASHQRARHGLGRVFQNSGVFRDMTVAENIVAGIEGRQSLWKNFFPWSQSNRVNRGAALEYLEQVGLTDKAQHKAGSLSGGQLRMLEIVRTLAFGAEVFLLDEPTAGVAPKMKDQLAALILKLKALGKTVLVIEHDINFIDQLCDRIAVLDLGRVALEGEPKAVRNHPLLHEIYFGGGASGSRKTLNA